MSERPDPIVGRRVGVLVSGRGSNLQALIDAVHDGRLRATIALVLSNVADAPALARATGAGIETLVASHRDWPSREAYDEHLAASLRAHHIDVVCLAGFMRRLTSRFFERFGGPVLNVHPSLLPAFPGVAAPEQALAHGVRVTGCTVHLVTPELDAGPIVSQAAVPVHAGDSAESLAARILVEEHRLLPAAVARRTGGWMASRRTALRRGVTHQSGAVVRSVSTDTSAGQLIRIGANTVPTPRLTYSRAVAFDRLSSDHRKAPGGNGTDTRQHHLAAVRMTREHQLNVQAPRPRVRRRGSCASSNVVGPVPRNTFATSPSRRVQ